VLLVLLELVPLTVLLLVATSKLNGTASATGTSSLNGCASVGSESFFDLQCYLSGVKLNFKLTFTSKFKFYFKFTFKLPVKPLQLSLALQISVLAFS
jgi:hypothetical protein